MKIIHINQQQQEITNKKYLLIIPTKDLLRRPDILKYRENLKLYSALIVSFPFDSINTKLNSALLLQYTNKIHTVFTETFDSYYEAYHLLLASL